MIPSKQEYTSLQQQIRLRQLLVRFYLDARFTTKDINSGDEVIYEIEKTIEEIREIMKDE